MNTNNTFLRNTIQLADPRGAIDQLLYWLADNAQALGLLITPVQCEYEYEDKPQSIFKKLKDNGIEQFVDNNDAGEAARKQRNIGGLVRYQHQGRAYGLSITFRRHEVKDDSIAAVQRSTLIQFINNLPTAREWHPVSENIFRLSLLRMCTMLYAFKDTFASDSLRKNRPDAGDYEMINFSDDSLVYRWPQINDVFRLELTNTIGSSGEIHLKVVKPKGFFYNENENEEDAEARARQVKVRSFLRLVDCGENGLLLYDRTGKKSLLGNGFKGGEGDYKLYASATIDPDAPAKAAEARAIKAAKDKAKEQAEACGEVFDEIAFHSANQKTDRGPRDMRLRNETEMQRAVNAQLKTRLINEKFWSDELNGLLQQAGVKATRLLFTPNARAFVSKGEHGENTLSHAPMGADLRPLAPSFHEESGITLVYAFMGGQGREEFVETLRDKLLRAANTLNEKKRATARLTLREVDYHERLEGIDLVIDVILDNENKVKAAQLAKEKGESVDEDEDNHLVYGWKTAHAGLQLDDYGQYRKLTIDASRVADKQLVSSVTLLGKDINSISSILLRCAHEIMLKKWFAQGSAHRRVQVDMAPLSPQRLIVMGLKKWRQKDSGKKPAPFNCFTAFYEVNLFHDRDTGNTMRVSRPQIMTQWGREEEKSESRFLKQLDAACVDHEYAITILPLLMNNLTGSEVLQRMDAYGLNDNTTYLFDVSTDSAGENELLAIWEIIPEYHAALAPNLINMENNEPTFTRFIEKAINSGSFSRAQGSSQIGENKRLKKDAEYDIQYAGNEVIIARKNYSENAALKRTLLQRARRIFNAKGESELTQADIAPIVAGLLSDEGTVHKLSGAKQSLYEKLIKLAISD